MSSSSGNTNSKLNMEQPNDKSQPLTQPRSTYQQFRKSVRDLAQKVHSKIQVPRKKFQRLDEARGADNQAEGGDGRLARHAYNSSVTPEAEDRERSRNQSPDIGGPSGQDHVSTQDVTSQMHGAHHFTIGGNPHFENNRVKNEYHYGNHGGTYDLEILKEFVSFKARHDSSAQDPTRRVHPGTRQYVLKRIWDWIDTPSAKERIFWLHGPAGVGKSAIAQTIARSCAREKLAATFFFFRSDPSRNDGNRLFTTLAWQFAYSVPATRNVLVHSLNERPDIPMTDLETQFEELIVKPFLALKSSGVQLPGPVVIIDGVDECSDDDLQQRFLEIIGNAVKDDRVPLRFFICSRPEAHIQDAINTFRSLTLSLDLAELNDANKDIEKYLKAEFSRIAKEQDLDPAWPGQQIIQEFVSKASGQFVYAATVIKYVGDKYSSAETQLDIIRGLKPPSTISPFAELDELYKEILRRQRDPVFLKDVLSLLVGRDGIRVDGLHEDDTMLMNVSKKELHRKLRGMHSLLKLEPYLDIHHRSFIEFLQDPSRSSQYHISKQAGTRRYLDFIAGSLVRYASTVIERHDDHKTHFSPRFHELVVGYPAKIALPVEEWQEALQPLLDIWNKLLTLPNFRCTWQLLPCDECTGFHTMRSLLSHLAFRLQASDSNLSSPLIAEFHTDGSEGMHSNVTPSTQTEIEMDALEEDLSACLSSLLSRLRRRKFGISLDTDTIQLTCSLLRFDHTETAMKLRSITDAQNFVDLIDEIINNEYFCSHYGPDVLCKVVRLALEIYARVPVFPWTLFSKRPVGPRHHVVFFRGAIPLEMAEQAELLFQTAFMCNVLDPNYIVPLSLVYGEHNPLWFVDDEADYESLSEWRKRSKPSTVTRIRVMLEVAKAIRYFHSMGIVLHDRVDSDSVFLDSEFHAKFLFLGLIAHYVKVAPDLSRIWRSHEPNIFLFGCLFYEMCFAVKIARYDRITCIRDPVTERPLEPEICDDEWQLIQLCCAEDLKSRPTMDDIVREMEAWDIT